MMKRIFCTIAIAFCVVFFPGCLDNKPHQESNAPLIENRAPTKGEVDEALNKTKDEIAKHVETSQTAIQQNIQSLIGGAISDLIKATVNLKDLIHAELTAKIGEMNNQLQASLASNNDIRAMLKAQVDLNAKLQADLSASIKANAELQAQLDLKSMISGQVGFNDKLTNTISDFKQTLSAGHDVVNNTVQFTKDYVQALQNANAVSISQIRTAALVIVAFILVICAAVCFCFYIAWGRAENRCQDKDKECKTTQAHLERAMGMLAPDIARSFFPNQ